MWDTEKWWIVLAYLAALLVTAILFLVGLTTHQTKIRQDQQHEQEMVACIHTDRTAAECRAMVYGTY